MDRNDTINQPEDEEIVDVETEEVEVSEPLNDETVSDEPVLVAETDEEVREETPKVEGNAAPDEEEFIPLFTDGSGPEFRNRWLDIQARFVDDPKASVRDADELVKQVIQHITDTFSSQHSELESRWKGDGDNENT